MKRFLYLSLCSLITLLMHSCTISTTTQYHSNKNTSLQMDVTFADKMAQQMAEQAMKSGNNDIKDFPREWTSMYDIAKKKNQKLPTNPDSIAVMKKLEMKSTFNNDVYSGFSMRFQDATPEQSKALSTMMMKSKDKKPTDDALNNGIIMTDATKWDGSKLVIDLSKLSGLSKDSDSEDMAALKMFNFGDLKIQHTFKFDNKIDKIEGKNDLIKKVDDKTMQISFSLNEMLEGKQKAGSNKDSTVTIYTK